MYCRVSTEEQAKEGFSIKAQQDKLKDYIKIKGWEFYDIYIDDGISGKNIESRPEVNRLIADVVKGNVENVLVFKIDRLTRSTKDLISLMDLFNENSCAFNSLMESIDTHTPSGRMFIKIIGIFAEFERENIIERVSVALEKKVREGYILSNYNIVPYGYSRQIGQREITINEEESKVVKEIFNLYLHKHKSFNAIATELNRRGILSSTGVKWGSYPVSYILSNPLYMGKVRYSTKDEKRYFEAEGKHEAIISEEIFSEVKSKMAKMQRIIRKRPHEENYFCGTLMCGECGKKMTT
ncbi:MAG: recombinase family protein, partial [Oscillospiraceae bacterium]|nr:recombinase family protein [Oscillospiraceae bacterium]